jgi:hypothetical protein
MARGAPRVAYIASVERSGSTMLDLLIGAQGEGVVSLGEVRLALIGLRRDPGAVLGWRCTCGEVVAGCPLWGALAERTRDRWPARDDTAYAALLELVAEQHGSGCVVVDSSKSAGFLERVSPVAGDLRLVRLTRDVRSWVPSGRRLHYPDGPGVLLRRARSRRDLGLAARATTPGLYLRWYRKNRILDQAAAATGAPVLAFGHEQLLAAPVEAVAEVLRFLDIPVPAAGPNLDTTRNRGHLVSGNLVRHTPELRRTVRADVRRLAEPPGIPWPSLLRPVMRYNAQAVYGGPAGPGGSTLGT